MTTHTENTGKEILATWQRGADMAIIVALLLLLAFFMNHQNTESGLFTSRFGTMEMIFCYGGLLTAMGAPMVSALSGRRNPARPVEIASNLFIIIGAIWLLRVWPFDFTHFADTLPESIRGILAWLNNDIAKIPLIITVIVQPFTTLKLLRDYLVVRGQAELSHHTIR